MSHTERYCMENKITPSTPSPGTSPSSFLLLPASPYQHPGACDAAR